MLEIRPEQLGSAAFRADYGLKWAYLAGAMYKGIASKELVVAMGRAGLMGFLGTGGVDLDEVEADIRGIQAELKQGETYGVNLLSSPDHPEHERRTVELYLRCGVRCIEAAAFMQMTPSLVRFRLTGLHRGVSGEVECRHRVLAKVSRPEVAAAFMRPAPSTLVKRLVEERHISAEQAELSGHVPISEDICVEADSGGHTDQGVAYVLMPAMFSLRDELLRQYSYRRGIRIGAAGGIGTPAAAAAAFVMGADFVLTGSVNQCTVEAGTSDAVKTLLQDINVQDTAYAPAGDMFELGAKVQVLRKGVFFPARANKLLELYSRYNSLEDIDEGTRRQLQEKYFKRSFAEVWAETAKYYGRASPTKVEAMERNPKQKMAAIFKWYFVHTTRLALKGDAEQQVDYQVHCGPALGAFNQWVKGTEFENWRNRRVAQVADRIMNGAAELLSKRLTQLATGQSPDPRRAQTI